MERFLILIYVILSPFLMVLSLLKFELAGLKLSNIIPFALWGIAFLYILYKGYKLRKVKFDRTFFIFGTLFVYILIKYIVEGFTELNVMFITFFWGMLYFIGINLNLKSVKKYEKYIEFAGLGSVILGIFLYHLNIPLYAVDYIGTDKYFMMGDKYRAMGTFVNPNAFAYFMILLYIYIRYINSNKFLFFKIIALAYGIYITYSRSALLIYLGILLIDLIKFLYLRSLLKAMFLKLIVPISCVILGIIILFHNVIISKVLRISDLINNPRWEKWSVALAYIFKNPITFLFGNNHGIQIAQNGVTFSDNQYLYFLLYFGIIGLALWLYFFFAELKPKYKYFLNNEVNLPYRKQNFYSFLFILTFCLMGLVSNIYFIFPISFYIPLLMGISKNLNETTVKTKKKENTHSILYILGTTTVSGGPNHVYTLLSSLSKKYKVVLVCPNDGPFFERFSKLKNVEVKELNIRQLSYKTFKELFIIYKEKNIHLIHSHGKGAGLYGRIIGLICGGKVVHTFHGIHYHKDQSILYKFLYLSFEKIMSNFTHYFINVSQSEKDLAEKLKITNPKNNKTKVIYNAVNINDLINQSKNTINEFIPKIKKLKEENYVIFGMVANFYFAKGHEFLIKSLSLLEEKLKVVLIGDGPLLAEMKELAKELGVENKVLFLGAQNDVYNYLELMDVFILCSRWEGMPISLIEAMYAGKPILGTNVVGIKEIVRHMENGILVETESASSIAEGMNYMLLNEEKRIVFSKNSQLLAENLFSLKKMISEVEAIYEELL